MDWRDPADRDQDQEAAETAFNNTEAEIAAYSFGDVEPEDMPSYRGDFTDRSLEDVTGWDSRPLPLSEIAASNFYDGIDRPMETARDSELQAKDAEIGRLKNVLIERHLRPEVEARQEAEREALRVDMYERPNEYINHLEGQHQALQQARDRHVNSHMERAHREHGADFEAAYQAMTALDPKDPLHRAVVQRIAASPDPGRALMDWHGDSGDSRGESRAGRSSGSFWVPPGRRGSPPPRLRGRERAEPDNPDAEFFNDAVDGHVDFWSALGGGMDR